MTTDATAQAATQIGRGAIDPAALLDALGDLVLAIDGETTIRRANPASLEILGLGPDKLVGRRLLDFIHVGERKPFLAALEELKAGSRPSVFMKLRISDSGYTARMLGTVIRRLSPGGDPIFVLVGRDQSPAEGEGWAETSRIGIRAIGRWRYDLLSKTLHWTADPAAGALASADYSETVDDFGLSLVHPDDRDECRAVLTAAIEARQPFFVRSRVIGATGAYTLCETLGVVKLGPDGTPIGLSAIAYDISGTRAGEHLTEAGPLELRELFSEISDVIAKYDAHGHYLYVSPSITRVLGYEPRDLLGIKNSLELIHPDDVSNVISSVRTLNTPGAAATHTYRFLHKEGRWVWLESKIRALMIGPNGMPAETAAVSRDITARKRAEEDLIAAYARAEAASATKSRFLANMSHELRTPLNAIIGFSDIIRRELFGAIGSARYKDYAQLIHESGGHLLDLINDILDMSKIEAGKFDLRFEAIDLEDLVRSSLKLLEPRASEAKLMLSAEVGQDKPHVQADRRAIKQILLNLLANAIKFTPPGGVVTVSLETLSDGAVMQVRDTGIGIAEKDLPRITLPFEQVTHDPLLAQAGSGLGLALVQSLVNLHMGTLKIDSVPGQGTCVTVFLPADPRSRKAA